VATWEGIWGIIKGLWAALEAIWEFAGDILMVAWQAFKDVWELAKSIFNGIIDLFKAVFQFIMELFDDPVEAFKNLFDNVGKIFGNILGKFWALFRNIFTGIWKAFQRVISSLWDAFTGIIDSLISSGAKIWDSFVNAFKKTGDFFKDFGERIWNAIKRAFKGLDKLFFPKSAWGKGTVEKFIGIDIPYMKFAEGGKVPGVASAVGNSVKNDIVPALLSPGEFVIDRETISSGSDAVMKRLMDAGLIQGYSLGGFIKNIGKAVSNTVSKGAGFIGDLATDPAGVLKDLTTGVLDITGLDDTFLGELINGVVGISAEIIEIAKKLVSVGGDIDWGNLASDPLGEIKEVFKDVLWGGLFKEPAMKILRGIFSGFKDGGIVPGSGSGDIVPAMLEPGELVVPKAKVKTFEESFRQSSTKDENFDIKQNIKQEFNIEVTIKAQKVDDKEIKKIASTVKDAILKESKVAGRRIIDPKGVR
jgi:hypothetical protein